MAELPRYDKRTAVVGSTGSGKTQFAVWLLLVRMLAQFRVWIVFDYKGDQLIEEIGAKEIGVNSPIPTKPGLYVVRPIPELNDEEVTQLLWRIWARGDVGVYIDEGYMVGIRNPALNACLTQGRSKHIEMIILSQRPKWMSKFVFSEANYFAVFNLTLEEDRKYVRTYLGGNNIDLLPSYHCTWYNVDKQEASQFGPVPDRNTLIAKFRDLLKSRRKAV
jgi:hypothetical protein